MAPSKELDTVLEMIRVRSAEVRKTTDDDRLSYERIMSVLPMDDDIETERVGVNGVPAEWIWAPESQENRVILYLHGGGYLFGSARTHRVMLAHMARAAKARVLALDYRLAPEIPFPAPVEDSVSAYRWLQAQGISPHKIAIGGDSAGGGLVVAALVALRSVGEPMPAAGVCISAWTDMESTGTSMATNAEADPSVSKERLLKIAKVYLGGKDPRAPLASPIHADLTGLPPLLLQVGSIEVLLDDSTMLKSRAKEAGVSVEMEVWEDMPHVWHHYAPILPEARKAIGKIGEFVLEHTG
ncbi:MAG: alpha/beta hydrolase [Chloroflexi bacterium]|jgi:acetyl esterase/lipase|nr:alpha/beta hydrolase [Chloroflexota bacterium]MDP6497996.1 alpha/beta hydrolase [Dehalococcoidia bacterium]MQG11562.1 alpha/beta hydrolase [SAR202 cluster bacterium]MQG53690.1 alpha/beta hydrolase [SAR202 cluster bacterium]|tara:strand:+ start:260 stop:1153 length:894 start_codon:yes stop_codon:yes gene_type:complete